MISSTIPDSFLSRDGTLNSEFSTLTLLSTAVASLVFGTSAEFDEAEGEIVEF